LGETIEYLVILKEVCVDEVGIIIVESKHTKFKSYFLIYNNHG